MTGDGVLLTPWSDDDAAVVLEIAEDPITRTWSPSMRPLHSLDDARAWIQRRVADPDRVDWAVRDPATRALIGRIGLHHFDGPPASAEVGYGVHPDHRRRGVARRAVAAALAHGTEALGLLRFSLVHAVGNLASCAVATSSGFGYEGTERSALDHGDGVLHDMHRHGRLATDPPGPAEQAPPGPLDPVELPGDGILLRPWEPADAEAVFVGLSDPLHAQWNPRLPLRDLDHARRWLHGRTERWRDGRACTWAVVEDGRVVGSVALRDLNATDRFAVASYWTMPAERGRGLAARALARASTYAFEGLAMHRVELGHAVANTASCRVAEKAGFRLEGTLREANRIAEGFADEHLHARLATDR